MADATIIQDPDSRQGQKPSGFLLCDGELMPYWTLDGKTVAELWRLAQMTPPEPEPEIAAENDNDIPF